MLGWIYIVTSIALSPTVDVVRAVSSSKEALWKRPGVESRLASYKPLRISESNKRYCLHRPNEQDVSKTIVELACEREAVEVVRSGNETPHVEELSALDVLVSKVLCFG